MPAVMSSVSHHVPSSVAEAVVDRPQWCAHTGVRWGHQNGSYQKQAYGNKSHTARD